MTIGGDIKITILSVDGDQVRIGIEAPREVRIFRSELIDETGEENQIAAKSSFDFPDLGKLPNESIQKG